jgi:anti-anti-sigma regulatory factor
MIDIAEVRTIEDGQTITVIGSGELDLSNAGVFSEALESAVRRGGEAVVDLTAAVFIDTAILACLAKYGTEMLDDDRRLKVRVVGGSHPQYVLKTVGFGELMDIETQ